MKKLTILIVAVLVLGLTSVLFAETDAAGAGGDIPFLSSLDITSDAGAAMASINVDSMDAGSFTISDFISVATLDANDSIKVEVSIGSWIKPAGYDGNKTTVDSDSDFWLKINGIDAADEVEIQNSFDSLVELTSSDSLCLKAIDDQGVSGDFTCDAKVDLDWNNDIIGTYAITVTFTLTQQTE